jgi:site-specific DNA-methyltransferase (adenine-specific)
MKTERNGKMITDWLEKNGNPAIEKQVEKELENMFKNKIFNENCLDTMNRMPDDFIDLTVTSPPYDDLREYKGYSFAFEEIAKELFRITKQGGVVIWVVGDATIDGCETLTSFKQAIYFKEIGFNVDTNIYHKQNYKPINAKRYDNVFEYIFILSKGKPKTFNPIMVEKARVKIESGKYRQKDGSMKTNIRKANELKKATNIFSYSIGGHIADKIAFEHPAIFPEQLANDHIISWSNENDLIYDCFAGSGTTAKMALLNKRNYIGSEISEEYCDIIEQRLNQTKAQLTMF